MHISAALLIAAVLSGELVGRVNLGERPTSMLVGLGVVLGIVALGAACRTALVRVPGWPFSLTYGACTWAVGWVLWPLWLNQMHRHPRSYLSYSRFPAESRPPVEWFTPIDGLYDAWLLGTVIGVAIAVALSGTSLVWALWIVARQKEEPLLMVAYSSLTVLFWGVWGPAVGHAIEWFAD